MFENDKQIQKGGDNSQQFQIGQVVIQGISEERAREICRETFEIAKRDFTQEAYEVANKRVERFEDRFLPKIYKMEGAIEKFADPSFQFALTAAQRTAASTEREADYDMLSELLLHRIEHGGDRKKRFGIKKAIEIVDQISDDALLGLTLVYACDKLEVYAPTISVCLRTLDNLYGKLMYSDLPKGNEWIEHLELLDAIKSMPFQKWKSIEERYVISMPGCVTTGIKKESDTYAEVVELLHSVGISEGFLIDNELLEGYVILPISQLDMLDKVVIPDNWDADTDIMVLLNEEQKIALKKVWDLYDNEEVAKIKNAFHNKINEYENIRKVIAWWDSISITFSITAVGDVLAHSNAKRCDEGIPSFE